MQGFTYPRVNTSSEPPLPVPMLQRKAVLGPRWWFHLCSLLTEWSKLYWQAERFVHSFMYWLSSGHPALWKVTAERFWSQTSISVAYALDSGPDVFNSSFRNSGFQLLISHLLFYQTGNETSQTSQHWFGFQYYVCLHFFLKAIFRWLCPHLVTNSQISSETVSSRCEMTKCGGEAETQKLLMFQCWLH